VRSDDKNVYPSKRKKEKKERMTRASIQQIN